MATVAVKRKMNTKSMKEKFAALREIGEGLSKSQVATKYEKIFECRKMQVIKSK